MSMLYSNGDGCSQYKRFHDGNENFLLLINFDIDYLKEEASTYLRYSSLGNVASP